MDRPGESAPDVWYRELWIEFPDGTKEYFYIERKATGTHIPLLHEKREPWTDLNVHKCPCCPLPPAFLSCPAAVSLQTTLGKLRTRHSIEQVKATAVDARGRSQTVEWPLPQVGGTLVQLAVFTSDCPVGHRLKPYLVGLTPFVSSLDLSKHLASKILEKYGGSMEAASQEFKGALEPLPEVFNHLAKRLRAGELDTEVSPEGRRLSRDAVPNSISTVDAFIQLLALRADRLLGQVSKELGWEGAGSSAGASGPAVAPKRTEDGGWLGKLRESVLGFFRATPQP